MFSHKAQRLRGTKAYWPWYGFKGCSLIHSHPNTITFIDYRVGSMLHYKYTFRHNLNISPSWVINNWNRICMCLCVYMSKWVAEYFKAFPFSIFEPTFCSILCPMFGQKEKEKKNEKHLHFMDTKWKRTIVVSTVLHVIRFNGVCMCIYLHVLRKQSVWLVNEIHSHFSKR